MRDAGLRATKIGSRLWIDEQAVRDLAEERARWISFDSAADLVGCSTETIAKAVRRGQIEQREVESIAVPSLERASVERFAGEWLAKRQAESERLASSQMAEVGPPDDGDVWLDAETAAIVLGVSASRVRQLARADRLPGVQRGRRRWFRRIHIELTAASRAFRNRALHAPVDDASKSAANQPR